MTQSEIPPLLRESNRKIRSLVEEVFSQHGLNDLRPQDGMILWYIVNHPGCSSTDLQVINHMAKSSISESLSFLCNAGYIAYSTNEENRREKLIAVTEKGIEHQRKVGEVLSEISTFVLNGISEEEQEVLKRSLKKIIENTERRNG